MKPDYWNVLSTSYKQQIPLGWREGEGGRKRGGKKEGEEKKEKKRRENQSLA